MSNTRALVAVFFATAAGLSAQTLNLVSGNGQIVGEQFLTNAPLVVQALDASRHPIPNQTISWSITKGHGTVSNPQLNTDSNGMASANFLATSLLGPSVESEVVTASSAAGTVNFFVTTVANFNGPSVSIQYLLPTPGGPALNGAAGSTLAGVVQVSVVVGTGVNAGQPIPNVGIRIIDDNNPGGTPAATCAGAVAGIALTDNTGTGTCNLLLTGSPGTYQLSDLVGEIRLSPFFTVTITQGASCTYSLSSASASFGAAGGNGSVNVQTTSTCGWTASSNASFLSVTSGASGTGNGTVNYSVTANASTARSGTLSIAGQTFTVNQGAGNPGALTITSASGLPPGTVNATYPGATLAASGGQAPYTWSVTSGSLPPGLTLNASTAFVSGTPTTAGSYNFTATVKDSVGASVSQAFSITINTTSTSGFTITNGSFPNGVVGQAYQQLLTTSGGTFTPFSQNSGFTVSSGALPAGLSIVSNTDGSHSISGTPQTSGQFNFSLTATDGGGHSATAGFTITVTGTPAQQQLLLSQQSLSFTVQSGSNNIPAAQAITLTANTGVLSYSSAAKTNSGGSWLTVTGASNGNTPGTFMVSVANFSALSPGAYNGSVTVSSNASNAPVVIGVTLTVLAAPTIAASPTSIGVNRFAATSAFVTQQNIQLSSGGVPASFTAAATTSGGGSWLSVTPASGTTPAALTASLNPSGLTPGTYTGTVVITPAAGAPINVTITLTVLPPATLVASPAPMTFTYAQGSPAPAVQTLGITSTGAAISSAVTASTQDGAAWLFVTPSGVNTPGNLNVSVNPTGLSVGSYSGTITLAPSDASLVALAVPVTLTVVPGFSSLNNAATFLPGAVAPGEFVTVFGAGLGPATPAIYQLDANGNLPTTLGGTQVLFDGSAAPLLYTADGQINTIVPYELAGNPSTNVQVVYNGQQSRMVSVTVVPSAPAIFPYGQGGWAILNQDGSVNSAQNGALPGSVVSIFATGAGQTNPAGVDGTINPSKLPLPVPMLATSAQINGVPANVSYFGAAPGGPSGFLQINAQIPVDAPRGSRLSVVIQVGNAFSQSGVTVAIAP